MMGSLVVKRLITMNMESEIDIGEEYWLYHEKYIVSQHNFVCNSC